MGTTLSGPQVYIPDPANTQQSPGQGWSSGISAIGNALFPNPAALSEARLRAAQTQQVQQNIQTTAAATGARSHLASLFAQPGALADPNNRSQASSLIAMLPPDEQAQARQNIAIQMANSGMPKAAIDDWNASAGLTSIGNTPTGQQRDLQNRITTAQISAGPGYAQAAATLQAERERTAEQKQEFLNTPVPVVDTSQPSGTGYSTRGKVIGGGFSPILSTDEQKSAWSVQAATPGSHGTPPPPANTQPGGGGGSSGSVVAQPANAQGNPVGTSTGAPAGPTSQETALTGLRILAGQPPGQSNQSTVMSQTLNALTARDFGQAFLGSDPSGITGSNYVLAPDLAGQVLARANEIMHQRIGQGGAAMDPGAAVTQAYNEIVTPNKDKIAGTKTWNYWSGAGPQVSLPKGMQITPPAGAPATPMVPSANAAPAAPALPPSGRAGIPPPPQAGAPAQAPQQGAAATSQAPVGPAPMPPSQLVPHRTKVNGYVYTGGDPRAPTSWAKAAPGG